MKHILYTWNWEPLLNELYNKYIEDINKTTDDDEKIYIKNKYIEDCKELIKKIRGEILSNFIEENDSVVVYNDDFGNWVENWELEDIEKINKEIKEEIKKLKELFEEQKDIVKIKKNLIKKFKQWINKFGGAINEDIHFYHIGHFETIRSRIRSSLLWDDLTAEGIKDIEEREFIKKNLTQLDYLNEKFENVETQAQKIIEKPNKNISLEDIYKFYDKILDMTKQIYIYANVGSIRKSRIDYKTSLYTYSKSWINKKIKCEMDTNYKDLAKLIPDKAWE